MNKSYLAAIIVLSVVFVTVVTLGVVYSRKQGTPGGTPLTPQQQCNANGYIWNPDTQTCTSVVCEAQVDPGTGVISGQMLNASGTQCVNVDGAYFTPFTQAALLKLCQNTSCDPCPSGSGQTKFSTLQLTPKGPVCGFQAGCNTKPYFSNSIMDGCPYLTYQTDSSNQCVPPTTLELQQLCNTSVNGCPLGSNLNNNCPSDTPCFNPSSSNPCLPQLAAPGCRPMNQQWQWIGTQCVNTTVSNTIAATISSATVNQITGTYTLDNIPANAKLLWNFVLSDNNNKSWQGQLVIESNNFTAQLQGSTVQTQTEYTFEIQLYTSDSSVSPFVLTYTTVAPLKVKLQPAPVAPGLTTIVPQLSLDLAKQVASNVPNAITLANNNSDSKPFVTPTADVWSNSLQGIGNNQYLIVPCTTAYCKTEVNVGYAMLILAWPPVTTLSADQQAEIKKACSTLDNPQISYAVYIQETSDPNSKLTLKGDQLTDGTWLQPIASDPTKTWLFRVVAYVWSGSDSGITNSTCLSQPLDLPIQVPTNLYSAEVCYNIAPLKPQGQPIPGNFMVYHPGDNTCSSPLTPVEALGARDFSCLTLQQQPTLDNMLLYACDDTGYNSNCNSSGQGCQPVLPVTSVRKPTGTESTNCKPPTYAPPCGGAQYCQEAACNCPNSVEWENCGTNAYAQVGTQNAVVESRWKNRVNNVSNFIQTYGLDKLVNVQTFLNQVPDVDKMWDSTYGASQCPLSTGKVVDPQCDATNPNACQQNEVCSSWEQVPGSPYLYKHQVAQYPTSDQQTGCCPSGSSYFAGCCCQTDPSTQSCADLKSCSPVANVIGKTWCQ